MLSYPVLSAALQVWYEWAVEAPAPSALHNAGGYAASVSLEPCG